MEAMLQCVYHTQKRTGLLSIDDSKHRGVRAILFLPLCDGIFRVGFASIFITTNNVRVLHPFVRCTASRSIGDAGRSSRPAITMRVEKHAIQASFVSFFAD